MPKQKRIFISYSHADHEVVRPLVDFLRITEVDVFLDVDSIKLGAKWSDVITNTIVKAETFLIFWSKNAAESEWVKREYQLALSLPGIKIIPVPLDRTPLPDELSQFHALTALVRLLRYIPQVDLNCRSRSDQFYVDEFGRMFRVYKQTPVYSPRPDGSLGDWSLEQGIHEYLFGIED